MTINALTDAATAPPLTAEAFPRAFAALWGARDAEGLADLMAEDGTALTLTGGWGEGRRAVAMLFNAEMKGTFSRSRLVTGKAAYRAIGTQTVILHQRFVLSGLVDETGGDLGRVGAMLTAVLVVRDIGWQAVTLQFTALNV